MLVLETGSGIRGANSYNLPAFVTSYLTVRGRVTENGWDAAAAAQQDAACIAATDYLDQRHGPGLLGVKARELVGVKAQAIVQVTTIPVDGSTITVGERTYTYRTALAEISVDEILIGADVDESTQNTIDAIGANQPGNTSVAAVLLEGTTDQILFTALAEGESGNDIPLAVTGAELTITSAFAGGQDSGPQPLEFPRANLVTRSGAVIIGVPRQVKEAHAEYTVRSLGATLAPDPTTDATGARVVETERQVGPLRTRTQFFDAPTLTSLLKPYPAADRLLASLKRRGGKAVR